MAGFLYWLPGVPAATREAMARLGLEYVFAEGEPLGSVVVAQGPDGGQGVVAAPEAGRRPLPAYRPDRQEWQQTEGVWIGYEKDGPPGPEDLVRPSIVPGHAVRLADGRDWIVPVARQFPEGTGLPRRFRRAEGAWVPELLPEYRALFEAAGEASSRTYGALAEGRTEIQIVLADELDLGVRALAVNYRLGAREVGALGLLTTENYSGLMAALIDLPSFCKMMREVVEAKKKSSPPEAPGT